MLLSLYGFVTRLEAFGDQIYATWLTYKHVLEGLSQEEAYMLAASGEIAYDIHEAHQLESRV